MKLNWNLKIILIKLVKISRDDVSRHGKTGSVTISVERQGVYNMAATLLTPRMATGPILMSRADFLDLMLHKALLSALQGQMGTTAQMAHGDRLALIRTARIFL